MPKTEVMFLQEAEHPCPFLFHLLDYTCDGKEGKILFEGYYHGNNSEDGPQPMKLCVQRLEDIPTLIVGQGYMSPIRQEYRVLSEHIYLVEVYKTIVHTQYKHLNKISICFRILREESY